MLKSTLFLWLGLGIASTVFAADIDQEGLPETGLDTANWTTGALPSLDDIFDLNDMQIAAKNTLAKRWYGMCILACKLTATESLHHARLLSHSLFGRGDIPIQPKHLEKSQAQWVQFPRCL